MAVKLHTVACRQSRISPRICSTSRSTPPARTRAAAESCSLCWTRSASLRASVQQRMVQRAHAATAQQFAAYECTPPR
jgi:hypothetical protein